MSQARRRGFTLIELMVVIVILGALVALVGPNVWKALVGSTRKTVEFQIKNFASAVEQYYLDKRQLPSSLQDLTGTDDSGEPWLQNVPQDPWQQDYQYRVVNPQRREYVIESGGDDRAFGTEDDIIYNSKEGFVK
jgi:general secretion pathway protein G